MDVARTLRAIVHVLASISCFRCCTDSHAFSPKVDFPSASIHLTVRHIRSCGSNVTKSIDLLENCLERCKNDGVEPLYLETFGVLKRAQRYAHVGDAISNKNTKERLATLAVELFEKCPTESCRAQAISICGQSAAGYTLALDLLRRQPLSSIQSYNAALAACAKQSDWEEALSILQSEIPSPTTLSCNIVLGAMEQSRKGSHALRLLQDMMDARVVDVSKRVKLYPPPDRCSFHHAMSALISSENRRIDDAYNLMEDMMCLQKWYESDTCPKKYFRRNVYPNVVTFDLLSCAYSRAGNWLMANQVEKLGKCNWNTLNGKVQLPKILQQKIDGRIFPSSQYLWDERSYGMQQDRTGKYWTIGKYEDTQAGLNITVALQPHRNPRKNGIKLLFLDCQEPSKLGFLLMINSLEGSTDATSSLLGMYVDPSIRKLGVSKVFLAIWLDLCLRARILPKTGIMKKPLLALVLCQTFGFHPDQSSSAGVEIEICRGDTNSDAAVELYAPQSKSLQGVFSAWDIKRENIRVLKKPPIERGRRCRIGTQLVLTCRNNDDRTALPLIVERELRGKNGSARFMLTLKEGTNWKQILIGKF